MHPIRNIFLIILMTVLLTGCCIHQWPEHPDEPLPEKSMVLHLVFNPDIYIWHHTYNSETEAVVQTFPEEAVHPAHPGTTDVYDNSQTRGKMRHTIRIYPADEPFDFIDEIVVTAPVNGLYDCDIPLFLEPGSYDVVVWSDLSENNDLFFHDTNDFMSVNLTEPYTANSDFRDSFRGKVRFDVTEEIFQEATALMRRPMAKYEFVATGLKDFIDREISRTEQSRADLSGYRVVFTYPYYLPVSYNVVDDRLVDARGGVSFESTMTQINDEEVSLGFDYVMINESDVTRSSQNITVSIAVYDPLGTRVASSPPIAVPVRRDDHTIIRSDFLSAKSQGGVAIDPNYDGDYNVWM